ncbi:MAG: hypothetical protein V4721_10175 [Bacteroidota bacterium]
MAINKTYQTVTITAAGLTQAFAVNDQVDEYNIVASGGAVALAADVVISSSGTPAIQSTFVFRFGGGFTSGAFRMLFFGVELTAAQALYEQRITAVYNGSTWDVSINSDMSNGRKDIQGADIVDGSILNAALAGGITLAKLIASAARGYFLRSGVNGVIESVTASTNGTFVGGNGTDVGPLTMSGDATLNGGAITIANNAITTVKILDAAVTVAKVSTDLKTELVTVAFSFETGEVGAIKFKMPYPGSLVNVYAIATKAIAATDSGTVVLKDNAGTTMTVTTPIVFAASDAFGTAYDSAVTANNTFVADDLITVLTAKTTAGGKGLLSLEILRS